MSLINEALRKAEQDRAAQRLAVYPGAPTGRARARRPRERSRLAEIVLWTVPAFAVIAVVALALYFRNLAPSGEPASPPAIADVTPDPQPSVEPADTEVALAVAADSPFADAPAEVAEAEAPPSSGYELAGMTAVGDTTLISVLHRSDQRSVWIAIGKSVGEITALSYNALSDQAVIRVRGELLTVGMRSGPVEPAPEEPAQAAE